MSQQHGNANFFDAFRQISRPQLIMGIVVIFAICWVFYTLTRDLAASLEEDVRTAFDQQNLTVVKIASSRVGFHIDNDVAENVRLLGQFPAMQRLELHNGTRDMEKVNTFAAPRVDGFVLFDAQGNLFTAYPESMKHLYAGNQSEQPFFKKTKETISLYFSDWYLEGDRLKMRVANPIFNRIVDANFPPPDDALSGILMAQIDFDRTVASELGRLKSSGIMHWIIDEKTGRLLYHSALSRIALVKTTDSGASRLAKALLAAFPSTILEPGMHRTEINGKKFSVASARSNVGHHRMIVNLAYDDSAFSGLVHEKTNRIYMIGLAFLIILLGGVTITLRQIANRRALLSEKEYLSRELLLKEEKKTLNEQVFQLQKLESLGELAAGTAHELNNALSGPMGILSMLQTKPDMELSKRKGLLDNAVHGMEQARSIVEGLLRFSQSERNEKNFDDINEDILFMINMYQKELDHKGIVLQLSLQKNLPEVYATHRQIQQVLLNLMTNARYVLNKGGIIKVRSMNTIKKGINGVTVAIQDNGPGITPEVQNRIFEPFFSTKPAGEGTGLGLSICYGIIQEHNGMMEIESEMNKGTTFYIWLPIEPVDITEKG